MAKLLRLLRLLQLGLTCLLYASVPSLGSAGGVTAWGIW